MLRGAAHRLQVRDPLAEIEQDSVTGRLDDRLQRGVAPCGTYGVARRVHRRSRISLRGKDRRPSGQTVREHRGRAAVAAELDRHFRCRAGLGQPARRQVGPREQQVQGFLGGFQTTGGIQAGRELKTHFVGADGNGTLRHFFECDQSWALGGV